MRSSNIPTKTIDKDNRLLSCSTHQAAATLPMHKVNSWVLAFRGSLSPGVPKGTGVLAAARGLFLVRDSRGGRGETV